MKLLLISAIALTATVMSVEGVIKCITTSGLTTTTDLPNDQNLAECASGVDHCVIVSKWDTSADPSTFTSTDYKCGNDTSVTTNGCHCSTTGTDRYHTCERVSTDSNVGPNTDGKCSCSAAGCSDSGAAAITVGLGAIIAAAVVAQLV